MRKEIQFMQQLRGHPNIIELHDTFEDAKVGDRHGLPTCGS